MLMKKKNYAESEFKIFKPLGRSRIKMFPIPKSWFIIYVWMRNCSGLSAAIQVLLLSQSKTVLSCISCCRTGTYMKKPPCEWHIQWCTRMQSKRIRMVPAASPYVANMQWRLPCGVHARRERDYLFVKQILTIVTPALSLDSEFLARRCV